MPSFLHERVGVLAGIQTEVRFCAGTFRPHAHGELTNATAQRKAQRAEGLAHVGPPGSCYGALTDVVDACVVEGALRRRETVVSSDAEDLQAIASAAGRHLEVELP